MTDVRRALPAVHALASEPAVARLLQRVPTPLATEAVRAAICRVREGDVPLPANDTEWSALVHAALSILERPSLRRVINATGVVLHTNLGRAPLARAAIEAIQLAAAGYTNIEYDLATGARGSRLTHARALLCELTGAEDAMVVNNCASALLLALRTFAAGRDVLVSRGELIEIGGSFRIPDVMEQADVRLVEVGTTNRTHLDDYRRALASSTGALIKVHRSNFTMDGFIAEVEARELVPVAAEAGIPLVHDLGGGLMIDLTPWGLGGEPTVREAIAAGSDVVLMSGDKLLGGPQAGIVLGRRAAVARMRSHPLARALRVDKLTIAALEATLALYRKPDVAVREIPVLQMIAATPESVRARAAKIQDGISSAGVTSTIVATEGAIGGGAFPAARLESFALQLDGVAERWERALRVATTPIIGRVRDGALLLDARTLRDDDLDAVVHIVTSALS